jgi:hypothetical protein
LLIAKNGNRFQRTVFLIINASSLDSLPSLPSISFMKAWVQFMAVFAAGMGNLFAQQLEYETSSPAAATSASLYDQLVPIDPTTRSSEIVLKKKYRVSGPLVPVFKAKKLAAIPGRLLQLVNPFARSTPKEPVPSSRELSPSAWSSTVGWHSGGPRFQDPVRHESQMSLISFGRSEAP